MALRSEARTWLLQSSSICVSLRIQTEFVKGAENTVRSEAISRMFSSNFRKQSFWPIKQMDGKGFTHIFHLRFDAPPPMLSDQVLVPQVANPPVRPSVSRSLPPLLGAPSAKLYAAINKGGHFIWVGGSFPPLFSSCADNRSGRRREGRELRTGKEGVGRLSPFFLSAYVAGPPPPLRLPCYQIGSVAMASYPPPHLTGSPVHIPYVRASLLHLLLVFLRPPPN